MDFVVGEFDMVFVTCIPLLENNLSPVCSRLRRNKFLDISRSKRAQGRVTNYLEVTDSVFRIALDPDFLSESVVGNNFNHNHRDPEASSSLDETPLE